MHHVLAQPILATSAVDGVTFAIAGFAALVGAIGVVVARNPVHSALMLVLTLFAVAVLFVAQDAQFLAAVQVIVYAGAIVVLFLFVIMLLGVDRRENLARDPLKAQRPMAFLLGLAAMAEVLLLARVQWATGAHSVAGAANGHGSNVSKLAKSIFTTYLLPFEITAALLVIAVVGAVVLSRRLPRSGGDAAGEDDGPGLDAGEGDRASSEVPGEPGADPAVRGTHAVQGRPAAPGREDG